MTKEINTNTKLQFRQLEWDYFAKNEKDNRQVAESRFKLPEWMVSEKKDCKITIRENNYVYNNPVYEAHIWWFNRGVALVSSADNIQNRNDCIDLVNKRIFELCSLFLDPVK